MQKMTVSFEVKAIQEDDPDFFYFEGLGSTFGNIDDGSDRVMPGAFKATLKEWASKTKRMPIMWHHKVDMPLGVFIEMKEVSEGLWVRGKMPKSDTFVSGRVIPQMKVGSVSDMSIGYIARVFDYVVDGDRRVRNIKEATLFETSLVTIPMNSKANITGMKSAASIEDLAIAPLDYVWDLKAAHERVSALSPEEAKGCYLYENSEGESKLLLGDVIEGKFHLVLEAVQSSAAAVQSGYKIPEGASEGLKSSIEFYYKKFGKESPFQEKTCITLESIELLTEREIERILKKGVCFSDSQAKLIVKSIMSTRREDAVDTEREARIKDVTAAFAEFKTLK